MILLKFIIFLIFGGIANTKFSHESFLPKECGRSVLTDRIINGRDAEIGEFPWIASLVAKLPNGRLALTCGGSLINKRYVLTAAHCLTETVFSKLHSVNLGQYSYSTSVRECRNKICAPKVTQIRIQKLISHEGWNDRSLVNDIGLVKLANDVKFNNFISPICLPDRNLVTAKDTYVIAGWGSINNVDESFVAPKFLQKATLKHTNMQKCWLIYRMPLNENTQVCAGHRSQDSCSGDSGGPLMAVKPTRDGFPAYFIIGIVSFGNAICGNGYPAVYTKVDYYYDWILQKMEENNMI